MLDLVEESLDQIPGSIEMRAEADRIVAIAARRNVDSGEAVVVRFTGRQRNAQRVNRSK